MKSHSGSCWKMFLAICFVSAVDVDIVRALGPRQTACLRIPTPGSEIPRYTQHSVVLSRMRLEALVFRLFVESGFRGNADNYFNGNKSNGEADALKQDCSLIWVR